MPLKKENIVFSDLDDLFNVFFSWLCFQEMNLFNNAKNHIEDELREIDDESNKTENNEKTSEAGKIIKANQLEKQKFGGTLENALFKLKYDIK